MSVTLYGDRQYLPTGRILENPLGGALYEFKSMFNPNVIYAPGHMRRDNDDPLEGLFDFEEREPSWMNWQSNISTPEIPKGPPPPLNPPPPVNPPPGTPEVRIPDPPPSGGDDVVVPEPSTFVLVLAALVLVMLFRRLRAATA